VFFLLTLPFQIVFALLGVLFGIVLMPLGLLLLPLSLLFLPFLMLRLVVKAAVLALVLPIVFLLAIVGLIAAAGAVFVSLVVPLLPFAALALLIWAVVRSSGPAYAR
jgi:hypothetical protein